MMIVELLQEIGLCEKKSYESIYDLMDLTIRERDRNSPLAQVVSLFYSGYMEEQMLGSKDELLGLAEDVRQIKEYSIDHLNELVKLTYDNVEDNKGHCYVAKDAEEARRIVGEIVGSGNTIVKVVDHAIEEIGLGRHLASIGNNVCEVAILGVLSKLGSLPKVDRGILQYMNGIIGKEVPKFKESLDCMRKFLKDEVFRKAEVGISGASVIAADPGALFSVMSNGTDRLVTMTPEINIFIVGMNDIVPSYSEAFKVSEYIMRSTGQNTLCVIGGPSKTGDIEKRTTYGVHGPRELYLVLLDNGRLRAAKDPILKEVLYCTRCGNLYTPPLWAAWTYILRGERELAKKCLEMGCTSTCPLGIGLRDILLHISRT
ncbi:MAG: hypothetical protein DRN78_04965 [Thermoproteota archaeon]|nr:MAG: hypothetical protein DRN78_04965 [Candidatus Korarchaeota archaeon]